jgi:hypothetical protein
LTSSNASPSGRWLARTATSSPSYTGELNLAGLLPTPPQGLGGKLGHEPVKVYARHKTGPKAKSPRELVMVDGVGQAGLVSGDEPALERGGWIGYCVTRHRRINPTSSWARQQTLSRVPRPLK